ncbi:type II secretion system protein GspD [Sulfurospirillum barnesii]|uniref:Type II secretory pathway, component PulD n=1 Tax=Sulfurospirillum barnesii (strain ATCC 700032 / DSM 10660 / SES-3) TaxID=760154 RepID=I3XWE7_SULBS|nr:type II and III secretion system protein [Sulfurospirillum barnesii]AFL68271.1 type II secretory pathway, component PulD [Sulfurospirillum barnesii SES-3]
MKKLLFLFMLCIQAFSIELAPTNFGLRDLTIQISQECNKNILVSQDIKNMSVDYFLIEDVSPEVLFETYKRVIESKGLFLNDYGSFYVVDEKAHVVPKEQDNSNIELTIKVIEINNEKLNQKGLDPTFLSNLNINVSSVDLKNFTVDKLFSAQFKDVLNALETQDYIKIVSEPYVIVSNNGKTTMNVGDSVSVKTSSYDSSTSTSVRNTYTQKDLGLTVSINPRILDNGLIALNVVLTQETLKKLDSDGLIQTSKKSINSAFNLKDGGSISLGGLTSAQDIKDINKIPVLGDIPLLEYLFKYESLNTKRSTLTFFIQVRVLK